jgi:hypothetical protein
MLWLSGKCFCCNTLGNWINTAYSRYVINLHDLLFAFLFQAYALSQCGCTAPAPASPLMPTSPAIPDGMVPISSNQLDKDVMERMKDGTAKDHKTQRLNDEVCLQQCRFGLVFGLFC